MASYYNVLQHTKPRFESPAKVFAKLKSKVQKEEIREKKETFTPREREKHGTVFKSPRKRAESTWMTDDPKENHRSGFYRDEAQALTLSPISSPQKTVGYVYSGSRHVDEMPPAAECRTRWSDVKSRAFSHPSYMATRQQIHTEPPQFRDGFSRTPVKMQPTENDFVSSVFEEENPLDTLVSPAYMLSPMKDRQRKRKWEPQEFSRVRGSTREASNESIRKSSCAFSENNNNVMEGFDDVRGYSADPSEKNQFFSDSVFLSPRSTARKRCFVDLERCPPMSPAKMFAFMKERENKKEQQEVDKVSSTTRDLFGADSFQQTRDTPPSTDHSRSEVENRTFPNMSDSVVPVESADSPSDTDPSADALSPAARPQPVLLEDPILLQTPSISIPKRQEALFKRPTKFPSESVIHLKQWFLRKHPKGLFVDGIHGEDNITWNSNIIVERVSRAVVKTISGRVYILVGKMNTSADSDFPKWLLKKFANGFPPNWEALYEKFLSESQDNASKGPERLTEGRSIKSKKSEESEASIAHCVKSHRRKPSNTPASSPPASLSCGKVSRSGRTIIPPLEYWKGGRVLLDSQMNVTIHECYDTSICTPEVPEKVSKKAIKKPAHVFLPCSDGRKQCESARDEDASGPLRKVKAPLRKSNKAKAKPQEKPSYSPEPPVEDPEEWSAMRTRSSRRRPATGRTLCVDTVPQKQPEKSSTRRSKTQTHDTTRPSGRVLGSRRAVSSSPESVNETTSPGDEVRGRKKTGKDVHRERGRRVQKKSRKSNVFPSSDLSKSSEDLQMGLTKRTRETQTKHKKTKSSSPTQPLPKETQSRQKPKANKGKAPAPQEQDEDEWTEAELRKLQDAVSYFPKNTLGYWEKVARMVGTRSPEECHCQHTSQETCQTPATKPKKPKKSRKEKVEALKNPGAVISARVGTLKRKQQVRQFLENLPTHDVDDVFSSAYMQKKRFEMPSLCSSEQDYTLPDLEPLTPKSTGFPEVKTPQCLHITPGMMGSPTRTNDDKYVYQLQKRMKNNRFNIHKRASTSKSFTPTPGVKRTMRRCANTENDTFVVWEMFPGEGGALYESGEEEDYYFDDDQS
ncbi:mis18-binding protein 1 [Centropristis striata]|uniref:mis18-binding protein 1 n=1 Tax=Centropristis striata TaxID=184440 RepID=UPI0027DFC38C|nr:mis18-binding protein 1 [Centropristis striata]